MGIKFCDWLVIMFHSVFLLNQLIVFLTSNAKTFALDVAIQGNPTGSDKFCTPDYLIHSLSTGKHCQQICLEWKHLSNFWMLHPMYSPSYSILNKAPHPQGTWGLTKNLQIYSASSCSFWWGRLLPLCSPILSKKICECLTQELYNSARQSFLFTCLFCLTQLLHIWEACLHSEIGDSAQSFLTQLQPTKATSNISILSTYACEYHRKCLPYGHGQCDDHLGSQHTHKYMVDEFHYIDHGSQRWRSWVAKRSSQQKGAPHRVT